VYEQKCKRPVFEFFGAIYNGTVLHAKKARFASKGVKSMFEENETEEKKTA